MPTNLNLFPVRVPIGSFTDASGNSYPVLMTPEFSRALADTMARLGGPVNYTTDELAHMTEADTSVDAFAASLMQQVIQLQAKFAMNAELNSRLASIARQLDQVAQLAYAGVPAPIDWDHPGKIGARTPNSAQFTTVNKVTITAPAGSATLTLGDGKTFRVNNSVTLTGTDGTTMTFPTTSATLARTDAGQTFTGAQTFSNSDNTFGPGTGIAQVHINGGANLGEGPRIRFERGGVNKGSFGTDSTVIGTNSDDITLYSPANNINFWAAGQQAATVTNAGMSVKGGGQLLATFNGLSNFAAAATATLTNAPTAGNPTKWVAINDNGTTRYLPLW